MIPFVSTDGGKHAMKPRHRAVCRTFRQRALPQAKHPPAHGLQSPGLSPVTGLIGHHLLIPEFPVLFRPDVALGTAMPEAAVHKDSQARLSEYKVRSHPFCDSTNDDAKLLVPPPADDAMFAHQTDQTHLRILVATGADVGHHLAAFRFGEDVSHDLPKIPRRSLSFKATHERKRH